MQPKFAELAKCWGRLQNSIYLLSETNQINNHLIQLSETATCCDEIAYKLLSDSVIETDDDRSKRYKGKKITFLGGACSVLPYSKKMKLEYYGFCTWMLAQGRGILIPGLPDLGIVVCKDAYYTFSAPDLALMFEDNPEKINRHIIEACRARIELIRLLDMYDQMSASYCEAYAPAPCDITTEPPRSTCEQEIQTELHPVEYHMDQKYMWNVWDLRRKAIQLANLRKCTTKSAQTVMSYYLNDVQLQVSMDRKSTGAQTVVEQAVGTVQSYPVMKQEKTVAKDLAQDLAGCLEVTKIK